MSGCKNRTQHFLAVNITSTKVTISATKADGCTEAQALAVSIFKAAGKGIAVGAQSGRVHASFVILITKLCLEETPRCANFSTADFIV